MSSLLSRKFASGFGDVAQQLPAVLPCLRYGVYPALPGGLPLTIWSLPWQIRPDCSAASTAEQPITALLPQNWPRAGLAGAEVITSQAIGTQPLAAELHPVDINPVTAEQSVRSDKLVAQTSSQDNQTIESLSTDASEDVQQSAVQEKIRLAAASRWYRRIALRAWAEQSMQAKRIAKQQKQVEVTAAQATSALKEIEFLKAKLLGARRAQVRRVFRARREHLAHVTLRAWAACSAESRFNANAVALSRLQLKADRRLETLHLQAHHQRVSFRKQKEKQMKQFVLRGWFGAAVRKSTSDAQVQATSSTRLPDTAAEQQDLSSGATEQANACSCSRDRHWGCACHRVYSGNLLLAHRELASRNVCGPPGLEHVPLLQTASLPRAEHVSMGPVASSRAEAPASVGSDVEEQPKLRGVWATRAALNSSAAPKRPPGRWAAP